MYRRVSEPSVIFKRSSSKIQKKRKSMSRLPEVRRCTGREEG